jgi:hypothetical protein
MAIAYVNGSTATQSNISTKQVVLNVPASVADGNLLVVVGVVNSSTATLNTVSGWTQLWAQRNATCNTAAWYRVASSEPASYTWTWSASGIGAFASGAWSGVSSSTVVEQYSAVNRSISSNSVTTPSGTPTQADWMLATYCDERSSSTGTTWSTPTGMSARATTSVTNTGVEVSVALFDTNAAVTGGNSYSYTSTPTSGTATGVAGIVGIMPPFTPPQPPQAQVIRQAVARSSFY